MSEIAKFVKALYAHCTSKSLKNALRVHSEIRSAAGEFLRQKGFVEIAPVILSPITDPLHHATGKATIEYYGYKYQLTRSMIMHKQISLLAYDKIFCFSPNIRLEPIELADTGRHLVEFTQLDIEVKNGTRDELLSLGEDLLIHILKTVCENCQLELNFFKRTLKIPKKPFEKIAYKNAYEKYGTAFESVLSQMREEPLWIVDIPLTAREFYDKENEKQRGVLVDMDLLYPEGYGEALSGGEREYTYKRILQRLRAAGLNEAEFTLFLEFAKKGLFKSAGFGIGIERLTRFVCGLKRIEDCTLFPKVPGEFSL